MKTLQNLSVITVLTVGFSTLSYGALQVNVKKQSEWNDGFCADVYVYNPDNVRIKWDINFNAEGIITNLCECKLYSRSKYFGGNSRRSRLE